MYANLRLFIQENLYLEISQSFFFMQGLVKTFHMSFLLLKDRNKAGHLLRSFFHFVLDLVWQWGCVIYGEHHIQHKAGVSYVSVCFYKEITFISKPEGCWGKLSQGPYSILQRKEGKNPT